MLDPKIKEGKKPLTGFDIAEVQDFIGEDGYFSDTITGFVNLIFTRRDTLLGIAANENYPFSTGDNTYRYFLPREWVNDVNPKPEKVWKPYDLETWKTQYEIGDGVEYRRKNPKGTQEDTQTNVKFVAYLGYSNSNGKIVILLGDTWFEFDELFQDFEIRDYRYNSNHKVEYRPFGYFGLE